mmetsp:Transcript_10538/g.26533  ORF Transcript_10538/g.26533 Transcript_10538/m.26533 type:complete len:246 (-) Transcript_10538:2628-3365(-)
MMAACSKSIDALHADGDGVLEEHVDLVQGDVISEDNASAELAHNNGAVVRVILGVGNQEEELIVGVAGEACNVYAGNSTTSEGEFARVTVLAACSDLLNALPVTLGTGVHSLDDVDGEGWCKRVALGADLHKNNEVGGLQGSRHAGGGGKADDNTTGRRAHLDASIGVGVELLGVIVADDGQGCEVRIAPRGQCVLLEASKRLRGEQIGAHPPGLDLQEIVGDQQAACSHGRRWVVKLHHNNKVV